MKRLGLAAVGLAVAVALAFGAGAFALYVWPGQEEAASVSPRYTYDEAIGLVRARLPFGAKCHSSSPFESDREGNWGALWAGQGVWWVEVWCGDQKEPRMEEVWKDTGTGWHLYEDSGQVIPMTDNAAGLMGQTHVVLLTGQ